MLDRYLADLADLEDKIYFRSRDGWQSPIELLLALLESAGLTPVTGSDDDRREQFFCYLNEERDVGNDLLFVIDGAEQVTSAVWLEFCKLSALICDDGYQPEVVIAGQPQAYEYLKSPMARDWNKHQFAVHRIPPLKPLDVCVYIKERLNSVGLPEAVFSPPARVLMGKLAGGSFVTTNLLCQISLITARQRAVTFVDEEIVKAAYSAASKLVSRHPLEDELLLGRGGNNKVSPCTAPK